MPRLRQTGIQAVSGSSARSRSGSTRPIPHNPMMDSTGRVWLTTTHRAAAEPGLVQARVGQQVRASTSRSRRSARTGGYYDPKTQAVHADRHLLRHAPPAVRGRRRQHAVFSNPGGRLGWINTKTVRRDRATSRRRRAGARPCSTPTATARSPSRGTSRSRRRGDGRRRQPNAGSARSIRSSTRGSAIGAYGIIVNPVDDSIWGATEEVDPGQDLPPRRSAAIRPRPASTERYMRARRSSATGRAASTSIATA